MACSTGLNPHLVLVVERCIQQAAQQCSGMLTGAGEPLHPFVQPLLRSMSNGCMPKGQRAALKLLNLFSCAWHLTILNPGFRHAPAPALFTHHTRQAASSCCMTSAVHPASHHAVAIVPDHLSPASTLLFLRLPHLVPLFQGLPHNFPCW